MIAPHAEKTRSQLPPPGPAGAPPRPGRAGRFGRRLLRLLAVVGALAVITSLTVVGLVAVGSDAFHHSASATEHPLGPINSQLQVGSTIYADDGQTVLAVLHGPQLRIPVKLSQISPILIKAVLDTEDHGFYVHGGVDLRSIARAALNNASGGGLQGGSTIAQQLAKQLYLTPVRKISRKIKGAVLADRLEQKYTKNQVLDAYLNTIYLGAGAYGVQAAAKVYFNEPASKLDLAQSALLAGMIQDPNGYDPVLNPLAARTRRAQVLGRMVVYHDITPAQAAAANNVPLPTVTSQVQTTMSGGGYYAQQVRDFLLGPGSPLGSTYAERYQALFDGGLKIYTNMDPTMQAEAQAAVASAGPAASTGFEEGLVSLDPTTGAVRALVGGPGTATSQFDVMTQGVRQPGSGFKLFTLLAALEEGYSVNDTVDSNSPCEIKFPGNDGLLTHPINNDTGAGGGIITVMDATANSVNCAYIRLAHEVGLPNVISMANRLGITEVTQKDQYPSMVIGAVAVRPIEMAAAYAAVADGGVYHQPSFISRIVDHTGTVIYQPSTQGTRVVSTQIAAEADQAFQAVVQYGTGTAAALPGRQVAGKTGTTDHSDDAWFNGYTPQIETTVWMGDPKGEVPMVLDGAPVYGADFPTRTWYAFDSQALANQPSVPLPSPDPALVPPSRYVTSPSLVADDVLNHNAG
jgi:membrane peptidoglycan carboxypeptidase